jgi:ADP-ribose pyrophosphatase
LGEGRGREREEEKEPHGGEYPTVRMEEILGQGRFLRLVRRGRWEYCQRKNISGIVVIVAVTDARELVLVEQERPAVARRVIELPAGLAGDGGEESLDVAARRELLEETGYQADRWERLCEVVPSPGLTSEVVTFYRALGLKKGGPGGGDETERIVVHVVPLAGAEAWLRARVAAGLLIDEKVYAGLYFAAR